MPFPHKALNPESCEVGLSWGTINIFFDGINKGSKWMMPCTSLCKDMYDLFDYRLNIILFFICVGNERTG